MSDSNGTAITEQIRVNTDALTLDDLVLLEDAAAGNTSMRELRDLFDRTIEGGAGKRKVKELRAIADALLVAVRVEMNPKAEPTTPV